MVQKVTRNGDSSLCWTKGQFHRQKRHCFAFCLGFDLKQFAFGDLPFVNCKPQTRETCVLAAWLFKRSLRL